MNPGFFKAEVLHRSFGFTKYHVSDESGSRGMGDFVAEIKGQSNEKLLAILLLPIDREGFSQSSIFPVAWKYFMPIT